MLADRHTDRPINIQADMLMDYSFSLPGTE